MGKRGPGAKVINERVRANASLARVWPAGRGDPFGMTEPWLRPGLQRWERVVAFIECLPVTSGRLAGTLMVLRPWQRELIRGVYGDGPRVVRTALWTMARKNGKTGLAAALCLCHLVGPESEPRGQIYSAAADREQASIIFREMEAIIRATPWLEDRASVRTHHRDIADDVTGSTYTALSSDAGTKHGLSASFWIFDELAQAPSRVLYDVLETSGGARAEPLGLVISTQSPDPHHIMSELVDYGEKVAAGVLDDPSFKAAIWRVPEPQNEEEFDPFDEAIWPLANPALGDFRSIEDLRVAARRCKEMPSGTPAFRNLFLNMRDDADQKPWLPLPDWRRCLRPIDPAELRGRRCYGGLDLSSTRDLCALALFFPDDDGGGDLTIDFWVPKEALRQRQEGDKVPYITWAAANHMHTTNGRAVNKRSIALHLGKVQKMYDLQGLAFDRWGMDELNRILEEEGLKLPLVEHGQGFKDMSPSMKATEIMVAAGLMRHPGNPVLTWCVSNTVVDSDPAENVKPCKRRSRERIDGCVAMIMATGLAARSAPKKTVVIKKLSLYP